MLRKSTDQLRQTKTELVRLVIRGPSASRGAIVIAEKLIADLTDGARADSRAARISGSLRDHFQIWFADEQSLDADAQKARRAKMLLEIGELVDLAARK